MRTFFKIIALVVLLSSTAVYAVADVPAQKVWVTPEGATAGTPITISAFLYNDQKETVTYTLEVKAADTKITTTVVTLPAGSAKTLTFDWKEPHDQTTVAVSILSALGKNKKDIPLLHGTLGAVLVGEKVAAATHPDVGLSSFNAVTTFFETFRTTQSEYFTTLRDQKRSSLGLDPLSAEGTPSEVEGIQVKRFDNPADYATLILATTLTSFFSHATLFYTISIIIVFLLIRFLVRMFI